MTLHSNQIAKGKGQMIKFCDLMSHLYLILGYHSLPGFCHSTSRGSSRVLSRDHWVGQVRLPTPVIFKAVWSLSANVYDCVFFVFVGELYFSVLISFQGVQNRGKAFLNPPDIKRQQ